MADSNMTKNALAESLKKLMRQRPFEKISVSDICEDCGINRKSFYYHFRDKYDLVNWVFYVGFVTDMDLNTYQTGWQLLEDICEFFYRDREFYRAALKIEGQNSFNDYLIEILTPIMKMFMQDITKDKKNDDFYLTFMTDALLKGMVRWLSNGYDHEMDAMEFLGNIRSLIIRTGEILQKEQP